MEIKHDMNDGGTIIHAQCVLFRWDYWSTWLVVTMEEWDIFCFSSGKIVTIISEGSIGCFGRAG